MLNQEEQGETLKCNSHHMYVNDQEHNQVYTYQLPPLVEKWIDERAESICRQAETQGYLEGLRLWIEANCGRRELAGESLKLEDSEEIEEEKEEQAAEEGEGAGEEGEGNEEAREGGEEGKGEQKEGGEGNDSGDSDEEKDDESGLGSSTSAEGEDSEEELITTEEETTDPVSYEKKKGILTKRRVAVAMIGIALSQIVIAALTYFIPTEGYHSSVAEASPSTPFFPSNSKKYLVDFYQGSIYPTDGDGYMTVVFYYAPWNPLCRRSRIVYQSLARSFHETNPPIRFWAVNCWEKSGDCRQKYKVSAMPIIVAYMEGLSLAYHGELATDHLYEWISRLLHPLATVHTEEQLTMHSLTWPVSVVGYFAFHNMARLPAGLYEFRQSSLLIANGDTESNRVRFLVMTNSTLAHKMRVFIPGTYVVISKTGARIDKYQLQLKTDKILGSVKRAMDKSGTPTHITSDRLFHSSSRRLSRLMKKGPLLVMATHLQPLYHFDKDVLLFDEVAREYKDCESPKKIYSVMRKREHNEILAKYDQRRLQQDALHCREEKRRTNLTSCCRYAFSFLDGHSLCPVSRNRRGSIKWDTFRCSLSNQPPCTHNARSFFNQRRFLPTSLPQCEFLSRNNTAESIFTRCCDELYFSYANSPNMAHVELSLDKKEILNEESTERCRRIKLGYHMKYKIRRNQTFNNNDRDQSISPVWKLGCQQKRTLNFALVDLNMNNFFVERWGLREDLHRVPILFILDNEMNAMLHSTEEFNRKNLQEFISNFHSRNLYWRPISEQLTNLRYVGRQDTDMFENYLPERNDYFNILDAPEYDPSSTPNGEYRLPIVRLHLDDFNDITHQDGNDEDVFIFVSGGPSHAASGSVFHFFLDAVHFFTKASAPIRFCSLDASANEIPPTYDKESLPLFIFIKAGSPKEEFVFASDTPAMTSQFISFVLARASDRLFWHTLLSYCNQRCARKNVRILENTMRKFRHRLSTAEEKSSRTKMIGDLHRMRRLQRFLHEKSKGRNPSVGRFVASFHQRDDSMRTVFTEQLIYSKY